MPSALRTTDNPRRRPPRHAFARGLTPLLGDLAGAGEAGNREIAAELARRSVPSETGRSWTLQGVGMLRHRIAVLAAPRRRSGRT